MFIKTANGNKNIPLQSFSVPIYEHSLTFEPAGILNKGRSLIFTLLNICENENMEDRLY